MEKENDSHHYCHLGRLEYSNEQPVLKIVCFLEMPQKKKKKKNGIYVFFWLFNCAASLLFFCLLNFVPFLRWFFPKQKENLRSTTQSDKCFYFICPGPYWAVCCSNTRRKICLGNWCSNKNSLHGHSGRTILLDHDTISLPRMELSHIFLVCIL